MQPLQIYSVIPKLPTALQPLWELAYNVWYDWKHEIWDFFSQIDHALWQECQNNPVLFLNRLPQPTLEELAQDTFFVDRLHEIHTSLREYLTTSSEHVIFDHARTGQPVVAYFSAEYGLSHSIPIYSGGLGILAGDHLKSASDLNLPLVGIGLAYQHGYFRQYLTPDGWQQERYPVNDFEQLPMSLVQTEHGAPLLVHVPVKERSLAARVWRINVGRIALYLLDANTPENPRELRDLTSRLYGGGDEMRLQQEILLGIGGIRLLRQLDLSPDVIHLNEGHSAFAGLERIRDLMRDKGLPFEAAKEVVASSSVFTTHTPVPAGNDRFAPPMIREYFQSYSQELRLSHEAFLGLGRENPSDEHETFCMTVLALNLSRFNNGVSKRHGEVSRTMWRRNWPQYPVEDVPIGSITNGVHISSWVSRDFALLFDRYLGSNWREDPDCDRLWRQGEAIPDTELWRTHIRLKEQLVDFVRERLKQQVLARSGRPREALLAEEVLDPAVLTIGFGRRFATYKRADLLFRDTQRLIALLNDTEQPIQLIFSGKAHPRDNEGKRLIQKIVELSQSEECRHRLVFLEDYDMEIARHLLQGCDVWLNTPRPPLEACGTSGMKAAANGVLVASTLDGWWGEAYKSDNSLGWSIGRGEVYDDPEYQDFVESQIIYQLLEKDIIPLFYDRGKGNIPREWIRRMKKGLMELVPRFNAHRMVEEYAKFAYQPAHTNYHSLSSEDFQAARNLASWRLSVAEKWGSLSLRNVRAAEQSEVFVEQGIEVQAEVYLDGLSPEEVRVEIYAGPLNPEGQFIRRTTSLMTSVQVLEDGWHLYKGTTKPAESGRFGFTVRLLPHYPLAMDPHAVGLIRWAVQGK
ncbi:alpha-glucan family phosphorylase [Desulfohalobium retbaense]|uniref:Alpha-glucan phosphorylase n=1 Tax=Desulfohalobium retbaense (strain ATCC 49708 / DSM 5692 / JCM 16813 / HR100) TaxID=485915 RepID=C8X4V6_DESRD|nr:alpha-glucan family phosphorylase [Desulfohalobium retbaense]ACV69453.1 alpha-glucan phosphorylase [Desulfohalobium retbaense DSM 5692]